MNDRLPNKLQSAASICGFEGASAQQRDLATDPFYSYLKGNLLTVGKRSPKPSMRVRLLLPLYERKALAFLFLMGNCESLGGFFLHREIVLPMKSSFTLRA